MTIIVGTNSYVSVQDADDYFVTRYGYDLWPVLTTEQKESALISAASQMDYMCEWICTKTDPAQDMQWPRCGDADVPIEIKYAQMEMAYQMVTEGVASSVPSDPVTELKAGSVQLKFENAGAANKKITDYTKNLLSGYGDCNYPGTTSKVVDVLRA